MMLTEKEHAEMVQAMGFDRDYVHPDHRQNPPTIYVAGSGQSDFRGEVVLKDQQQTTNETK